VLYEYTNKEADIVSACFRIGSYYSVRDLPDDLGPNNVIQAMREGWRKPRSFLLSIARIGRCTPN